MVFLGLIVCDIGILIGGMWFLMEFWDVEGGILKD